MSDFVLTHRDSPKVAHAGAEGLKSRGYEPIAFLWMRELAMDGGIKPPPEALAEAISVMQNRTLPDHPACGSARIIGMKVDVLAFEEWSRRAILSGEGYELVNATAVGPTLAGMGHLSFLVRVLTSAEKTVLGSEEFVLDVRALPQSEQERIMRTMRTIAADDNLKPWRQRELQRLLQEIEKPPSR